MPLPLFVLIILKLPVSRIILPSFIFAYIFLLLLCLTLISLVKSDNSIQRLRVYRSISMLDKPVGGRGSQ